MFTGLIEKISTLQGISKTGNKAILQIDLAGFDKLVIGESIAINGICLTLTQLNGNIGSFDASVETLRASTMQSWKRGEKLNLERALIAGESRLGGHFVSGHVDSTGEVTNIKKAEGYSVLDIQVTHETMDNIVNKGSIAIDGVSLTISGISGNTVSIYIIPETLRATTLQYLKTGQLVNIETDMLLKKNQQKSSLTMSKLKSMGW